MSAFDWGPILLSLRLAAVATVLLLVLCVPLAWALSRAPSHLRYPAQALLSLPLVLPPSVLGFYLLLAFSPSHAPARVLRDALGLELAFTFPGLVLGSLVFSLPFMVNPLLSGFDALPRSLAEASYVLGRSRLATLLRVQLPNLRPALLAGSALAFAHTLGEFGVVLMVGGKIPGETAVASIAVYDAVERLDFAAANRYALLLSALSFLLLLLLFAVDRRLAGPAGRGAGGAPGDGR